MYANEGSPLDIERNNIAKLNSRLKGVQLPGERKQLKKALARANERLGNLLEVTTRVKEEIKINPLVVKAREHADELNTKINFVPGLLGSELKAWDEIRQTASTDPVEYTKNAKALTMKIRDRIKQQTQPTQEQLEQQRSADGLVQAAEQLVNDTSPNKVISETEANALEYARKYLSTKSQAPTVSERGRSDESTKLENKMFNV